MCNVCCKEFKGWCKSFTRTETFLGVLECVLLIILIVLLGFTILHFLVCSKKDYINVQDDRPESLKKSETSTSTVGVGGSVTLAPDVQCTWKEIEKTEAATQYYERGITIANITSTTSIVVDYTVAASSTNSELADLSSDILDGEEAEDAYKEFVLALVKINPPQDVIFGCILVKITIYWTLTAASCIEAIEEVDSLDSFIIMEGYGELEPGRSHTVADVRIHPLYGGTNRSYDLAALRSEDDLGEEVNVINLPTTLDYYFTVIGERLTLLGYGRYRSVESRAARRGLRAAAVFVSAAARCAGAGGGGGGGGGWAPRRLARPLAAPAAGCRPRALCCGPRARPARPCNYCGGSPLLAAAGGRALLLAVMADNPQCGVSCEPAPFVSLAPPAVRGWLAAVAAA